VTKIPKTKSNIQTLFYIFNLIHRGYQLQKEQHQSLKKSGI